MQYFNILNCNSDITSCCTSAEMSYIMGSVRNLYMIIQIIVPIVLICYTYIEN